MTTTTTTIWCWMIEIMIFWDVKSPLNVHAMGINFSSSLLYIHTLCVRAAKVLAEHSQWVLRRRFFHICYVTHPKLKMSFLLFYFQQFRQFNIRKFHELVSIKVPFKPNQEPEKTESYVILVLSAN